MIDITHYKYGVLICGQYFGINGKEIEKQKS
jgi:hypothetical protein